MNFGRFPVAPLYACLAFALFMVLLLVACASTTPSTSIPDVGSLETTSEDDVLHDPPEVNVTLEMCDEWVNHLANTGSFEDPNFSLENRVENFFGTNVTAGQALDFYLICGEIFLEVERPTGPGEGNQLDLNYAICAAYIFYVTDLAEAYDTPQPATRSFAVPSKGEVVEDFLGHPVSETQAADFIDQCGEVLMAYGVFDDG